VHYYLPHGGVETIIHTLTNSLSNGCFDITVVLVTDWMIDDLGGPMSATIQAAGGAYLSSVGIAFEVGLNVCKRIYWNPHLSPHRA